MDCESSRIFRGVTRGKQFEIVVDGQPVVAYEGETIAVALLAAGKQVLRWTHKRGEPRGIFCGMGICFDCVMTVDGMPNVRTCVTPAQPGMRVVTQRGLPRLDPDETD